MLLGLFVKKPMAGIDGQAVITSQIALEDIVEKGFEALTKDRSRCKILVNMSL